MTSILALCAAALIGTCLLAGIQTTDQLSSQGCRMSYMSPSYILQDTFNQSWTPLARRYSLWLYREVPWEHELHGQPVLFIPGHAGSYGQVRSIASSSTRQFFSEPGVPILKPPYKAADYFALDLNEDFSAFHGPTLLSERAYASAAVDYILSLYPAGTKLVLLGHSMGGVVATNILPHANISAVITLATPHSIPPARFDRRIDAIYAHNADVLANDPTPIISICGGATDTLVPSESCILRNISTGDTLDSVDTFRRTVFASALQGAWTGVGHQAIVWCHQVRWRVARSILDLSAASTTEWNGEGEALHRWLSDGSHLPELPPMPQEAIDLAHGTMITDDVIRVNNPTSSRTYLMEVPSSSAVFTLLVSSGSVLSSRPQHVGALRLSVLYCFTPSECTEFDPDTLKLLPNPIIGKPFPVPREGPDAQAGGADESEGIVLFETQMRYNSGYVAIQIDKADEHGGFVAGFSPVYDPVSYEGGWLWTGMTWVAALVHFGEITINLKPQLSQQIYYPQFFPHALLAYRATFTFADPEGCIASDALLHPLLALHSPSEIHYHPLHPSFPAPLLHAHTSSTHLSNANSHGLNLTIHSSAEPNCAVTSIELHIAKWASLGRWGARLWPALVASAIGVVALTLFDALGEAQVQGLPMPSVPAALAAFASRRLRLIMVGAFVVSLLPLPASIGLGTSGGLLFAPLAPLMIFTATGLVSLIWWILRGLLFLVGGLSSLLALPSRLLRSPGPQTPATPERRSLRAVIFSAALISLVVFLFVPWQVAFLACWLLHLHSVAVTQWTSLSSRTQPSTPIQLTQLRSRSRSPSPTTSASRALITVQHKAYSAQHTLLLLTLLLPLAAPVLAVWARTLLTAGLTTPFDGDHNALNVLPFFLLVDADGVFPAQRLNGAERRLGINARWGMCVLGSVALLFGARRTWAVFDVGAVAVGVLVVLRIVPEYYTR